MLNPGAAYHEESPEETPKRPRRNPIAAAWHFMLSLLLLDLSLFAPKGGGRLPRTFGRVVRIVFGGLLALPALLPFVVAALVYLGTHAPRSSHNEDPSARGVYFDAISMPLADGGQIEGWLVPVVDEHSVMDRRPFTLKTRRPAVILVHDQQADRTQLLSLVRPLRDEGLVVLVLGLRTGAGQDVGTTFGIRESLDVQAAIAMLRGRPNIDGQRIAVVGRGVGANAAVLAAEADPGIAAVVLDDPTRNVRQLVRTEMVPPGDWLDWLTPFCKWGFEMGYNVDIDDLAPVRHHKVLDAKRTLVISDAEHASSLSSQRGMELAREFLARRLAKAQPTANVEP
jgi:hypothetical protein